MAVHPEAVSIWTGLRRLARFAVLVLRARWVGRRQLGLLASGEPLWARRGDDHLVAHPGARARLVGICRHLPAPSTVGRDLDLLVDFVRAIGTSTCVRTGPDDDVVYARRPGRKRGCTRFVRKRAARPCRTFRVVLRRTSEGLVEVRTAYVGGRTPPEPHSPTAHADAALLTESLRFWSAHALVWDGRIDQAFGVHKVAPAAWTGGAVET